MASRKRDGNRPSPRGHVTLRHVAEAAGVSPMTVSNFINARHHTMRPETRTRIEIAIQQLGYRPHATGRNLRRSTRLSIGMIIVDETPFYLADPFTTHIVAGLSNRLSAKGYGLQIQGLGADAFKVSPLIRDIRTDANCVLLSGSNATRRAIVEELLSLGQPMIAFQETFKFVGADLCTIHQADREGGRIIAKEALRRGARRPVMLVPEANWPAIGERVTGVSEVVNAAPGSLKLRIVTCGNADMADTQTALGRDIDANGFPDAVIAGNDQMGIAALKLVTARGQRVPEDVTITGFNAFDFWQYTEPKLTTMRSPAYEIGARGADEILKRLSGDQFERREIVFDVALQRGGST
jgi:LacI family transcriptional regulator